MRYSQDSDNRFRDLASELLADILSNKAVPALSAGLTSGLGLVVAQIAFGSFIFSGPLAPLFLPRRRPRAIR